MTTTKLSPEDAEQILQHLEQGGTLREARERLATTNDRIRSAVRRLGLWERYQSALHQRSASDAG